MEQTRVEEALKKLWKKYIEVEMELAVMSGEWSAKEEIKLDSIKETDEIIWYVEKKVIVK